MNNQKNTLYSDRGTKLDSKANNTRSSRPDTDQQLPSYRKTRPASATTAITVFSWRNKAREKSKPKVRDIFWPGIQNLKFKRISSYLEYKIT